MSPVERVCFQDLLPSPNLFLTSYNKVAIAEGFDTLVAFVF